ncbi:MULTISPECIES: HAD hydrolase family protein [Eubacteriales]|uniref:HAD hydrolase family protein n=1 Tax=Eubacteriales TaxID=186802 RepID=UPI00026F20E2|nr:MULTISPECIES: HAD hydrolase family protein [Eubacteriales]EJF40864.1 eukaryotic phosphomannomutase [Clostridium sp. MSTE9]
MPDTKLLRVAAFDLDGTLTQHKTPLSAAHRAALDQLAKRFRLLMVGAGMCARIFEQMEHYPIDILGNYGMQFARYENGRLNMVFHKTQPINRPLIEERVTRLRKALGFTQFTGDNVEYHDSGCLTFPLLGTRAGPADKLAFDLNRSRRRLIYPAVRDAFPEYNVFIGGSSSFDFAPKPFDKYYALKRWCEQFGFSTEQIVYFGDDYGPGGNDEAVLHSDVHFVRVDDYHDFPAIAAQYF